MEQISQISTIKRQNIGNYQFNYKEESEFRYSRTSAIQQQSESMNIERLLTSIGQREEISMDFSNINYVPVTNGPNFQQRKLNNSGKKNLQSSFCTATLNTTNPNLAIQSEPNTMMIGLSSYFEEEELDYNSRVEPFVEEKQLAGKKILKFIINLENRNYPMKIFFKRIHQFSNQNKENYMKSLSVRQSKFIDLALKKKQDLYWHQKTHDKVGLPYYNKLTALCAPILVANKKMELIEKNVEKFKNQKSQSLSQTFQAEQRSEIFKCPYKFNFEIVPRPPLHFEKKLNENHNSTIKRNG